MIIGHNLNALFICNRLNNFTFMKSKVIERLSTGKRINHASDDPAGLAISEKMRSQIRGLSQAQRNMQDAISMIQTGEGALGQTHDVLQRMKELAVQASNGTLNDNDRKNIQLEIDQLKKQIDYVSNSTEFNEIKLLNGSKNGGSSSTAKTDIKNKDPIYIQSGPNAGNTFPINLSNVTTKSLGIDDVNVSTQKGAQKAIGALEKAINSVSGERARYGAYQNCLEHAISASENYEENLTAALSRIEDADMAKEMMSFAKLSLLEQVNQFLLKQVIKQQENVLELLK